MNKQLLLDNLRCIPDWPIKGVNFRDVTTLFKDKDALREIADSMYDLYKDKGITKIVGIEPWLCHVIRCRYSTERRCRSLPKTRQTAMCHYSGELRQRIRHRHHRDSR